MGRFQHRCGGAVFPRSRSVRPVFGYQLGPLTCVDEYIFPILLTVTQFRVSVGVVTRAYMVEKV